MLHHMRQLLNTKAKICACIYFVWLIKYAKQVSFPFSLAIGWAIFGWLFSSLIHTQIKIYTSKRQFFWAMKWNARVAGSLFRCSSFNFISNLLKLRCKTTRNMSIFRRDNILMVFCVFFVPLFWLNDLLCGILRCEHAN